MKAQNSYLKLKNLGQVYVLSYTCFGILSSEHEEHENERTDMLMKGYIIGEGYMGYVDGRYMLFASEKDYQEYMED